MKKTERHPVEAEGPGIIRSYNISKFGELLLPYGFFAPHKSHLVNLQHLRKYTVEGTILMRDGSAAPVARRRKGAFWSGCGVCKWLPLVESSYR